jgi:hypothetical protein
MRLALRATMGVRLGIQSIRCRVGEQWHRLSGLRRPTPQRRDGQLLLISRWRSWRELLHESEGSLP